MEISLAATDLFALRRVLWASHQPPQDMERWLQQGFVFTSSSSFPLGLVQGHGGPCGVLAAVQAELVRQAVFPQRLSLSLDARRTRLTATRDETALNTALVHALAALLVQCNNVVRVVRQRTPATNNVFFDSEFVEIVIEQPTSETPALLNALEGMLTQLRGPQGVVLFVLSVLRTKGLDGLREEMDDPDNALTGQFGHCGQELLNLLLTGVATSNVFDGRVPLGDSGLVLRGIQQRPQLGYLTQLEALRYCQVGDYYKSPQTPVWVIGSASHFSVVFGLDLSLCEASVSLQLLQRVQRVFKAFDPMETGFMEMGNLAESLRQLGVANEIVSSDYVMAQLCSRLEVPGAGIILWDEYWRLVSVLVHTTDMELALSGKYREGGARPKTDEELAWELQAQFDAEEGGQPNVNNMAVGMTTALLNVDQQGQKQRFDLYYYNGLSKGSQGAGFPELKTAQVEVEPTREFIGDTIPIELSTVSGHGGHAGHPLEDILRTKWPSATFGWMGTSVPSVD